MRRSTLFIFITLAVLLSSGCGLVEFRVTRAAATNFLKYYASSAPTEFSFIKPGGANGSSIDFVEYFTYDSAVHPFPKRLPFRREELRMGPIRKTAVRAIASAFIDESVHFDTTFLLELGNVAVTLDGYNEARKLGFIYVTDREMPRGRFGRTAKLKVYIDRDEVYELMGLPVHIFIVSDEDPMFIFDVGCDPDKPALAAPDVIANRNRALGKLYHAARCWLQGVKSPPDEP